VLRTSARDGVLASAAMGVAAASKLLELAAARSEGEEGRSRLRPRSDRKGWVATAEARDFSGGLRKCYE